MRPIDLGQKSIIILGMHRSGTSALARLINLLGADLGQNLLPAGEDNKKGFWEHVEVLKIHERLLTEMGSIWDDLRPLPPNWWLGEAAERAYADLIEVLKRDFANSRLWAVKDPRMCRLLKLWHPIFDELKARPHFVIVFRNPLEVAASLAKRDGILMTKSFVMWLLHLIECELDTRDYPRVFVSMEQLLDNWKGTMDNVSQTLSIQWPINYDEVKQEVEVFLDPDLRHHSVTPETLETDPDVPSPVVDLYHVLTDTALHQRPLNIETFSRTADNLFQQMRQFLTKAFMEDAGRHLRIRRDLENHLKQTLTELADTRSQLAGAQAQLTSMLTSKSWRMTYPLRKGYDLVQRFRDE